MTPVNNVLNWFNVAFALLRCFSLLIPNLKFDCPHNVRILHLPQPNNLGCVINTLML